MRAIVLLALFTSGLPDSPLVGQAPPASPFAGIYVGAAGGPVSYNTQITFDGVDDPAGRGGVMYNAFLGFNQVSEGWLIGVEGSLTGASTPGAYTFDPAVTGFSDLDLTHDTRVGLDGRFGRLWGDRALLFTSLGYSVVTQSVHLDGVPLSNFAGGAEPVTFGTLQYGFGVEVAIAERFGLRLSLRTLRGRDLDVNDFGAVPTAAGLSFFDVEPSQDQFLIGMRYRL